MTELTIVRQNLMTKEGYHGYCGAMEKCTKGMPRTKWDAQIGQFVCGCGWVSAYPDDFIKRYRERWNK